jgi:predicted nucleic acid-binding protein
MGTIRTHFLDASAIVKLLISEPGSAELCNYRRQYSNFYTTSLCFAEALGVLKAKHLRCEITQEEYLDTCYQLLSYVHPDNIGIDIIEIEIKKRVAFDDVENLVKEYSIDVSDAFQIYTLKEVFSNFAGD